MIKPITHETIPVNGIELFQHDHYTSHHESIGNEFIKKQLETKINRLHCRSLASNTA